MISATPRCRICLAKGPLTWDHVPPRGTVGTNPMELLSFVHWLSLEIPERLDLVGDERVFEASFRSRKSSNGVKFKTLCPRCNNDLLGGRYDPELKRLVTSTASLIAASTRGTFRMPDVVSICAKTHLLLRAIVGHLLAAESGHPSEGEQRAFGSPKSSFYEDLRAYVLDETLPIPSNVRVYYWPFPSTDQVVVRGLALLETGSDRWLVGDLMKFYPLAFYVIDASRQTLTLPYPEIRGDGCSDLSCEVSLTLNLHQTPPTNWPETPGARHWTLAPSDLAFRSRPFRRDGHDGSKP